uniref:Uncharacterized protein n=1 Tax=Rhodnius prolixus TaxID=13249 RepID=T1HHS3_RHOPR
MAEGFPHSFHKAVCVSQHKQFRFILYKSIALFNANYRKRKYSENTLGSTGEQPYPLQNTLHYN